MTTQQHAGRYAEAALHNDGSLAKGINVAVYAAGTLVPATLYVDRARSAPAANPVATDSTTGMLEFYADPGLYDLAGPGISLTSIPVGVDAADSAPLDTDSRIPYANLPVGTTSSTVAAGNDSRITGAAQKTANLSDLASASTARTSLGLGTAATQASSSFQPADSGLTAIAALTPANNDLVQRKAGAWTNRTPAQVKTDLALTVADTPWTVVSKTTIYTGASGEFVLADATGGAFMVTPPSPTSGAHFAVKKTDSSANAVTIGATVDGTVNPTLAYQHGSMELVGDGSVWRRVVRPSLGALVDYPATTDARYVQVSSGALAAPTGRPATGSLPVLRDWPSFRDFGAQMTARKVSDAAISSTSGNAVVSSATAQFSSGDIGSYVQVVGAGSGGTVPLVGRITAVGTSGGSTTATLNATAGATVTGANATIGPDDHPAADLAVAWAAAYIASTGCGATLILPQGNLFLATASTTHPVTSYPSAGLFDTASLGIALPVNLAAPLTIKGQGRGLKGQPGGSRIVLSSAARNAFFVNQRADYDTFQNVVFEDFSVDVNGAPGRCHTLVGNMPEFQTAQYRLNVANLRVSRVDAYGSPLDATQSIAARSFIEFNGITPTDREATQISIQDVTVEDVETDTQQGVLVASHVGHLPNCFYDRIKVRRCVHRPNGGNVPSATMSQTSVYICGSGFGGYYEIDDCESYCVADDAIEVGAMQRGVIRRFKAINPFLEGVLFRNSQSPLDILTQKHTVEDMYVEVNASAQSASPSGFAGNWMAATIDNNATFTATTVSGSPNLTSISVSVGVVLAGQVVAGSGIPNGCRVVSVSGSSAVLSANATASASGVSLTGTLEFGHIELVRPKYRISDVNVSLFSRSTVAGSALPVGYLFSGAIRKLTLDTPQIDLRNVAYDLGTVQDACLVIANLTPPGMGSGAVNSPALVALDKLNVVVDGITNPGAGAAQWHVLWVAGQGEVDIRRPFVTLNQVSGNGGFTLLEVGRNGTVDLIRLQGFRGLANALTGGPNGVALSSSGTFSMLSLDDNDFRRWTSSGGFDVRFTNAPAGAGAKLTIGRRQLWSNTNANSLGGRISIAANATLTPVVTSVGVSSTASARTITLPSVSNAPVGVENSITVIDESNAAGTNNITAACAGSDTFKDGATSKAISTNGGSLRLYSNGTNWLTL